MPENEDKVGRLQQKLYAAAKADPKRRFHSLRDKVYRMDILQLAWEEVRKNRGAPGVDGVSIKHVEKRGVEAFLHELQGGLMDELYRPLPVRRVLISKSDGGQNRLCRFLRRRKRAAELNRSCPVFGAGAASTQERQEGRLTKAGVWSALGVAGSARSVVSN